MIRALPVRLTDDERLEFGKRLAEELSNLYAMEDNKKSVASKLGKEIETQEELVNKIRYKVASGTEDRPIDCHEDPNVELRTMELVRMDTGKVIESRPMSSEELNKARQKELPLEGVVKSVVDQINDGALGPDTTATVTSIRQTR